MSVKIKIIRVKRGENFTVTLLQLTHVKSENRFFVNESLIMIVFIHLPLFHM